MGLRAVSATAWMLLVVTVASFTAGMALGWIEMFVLAATSLMAVLIAVPFVISGRALSLRRKLPPNDRVEVGAHSLVELVASNPPKSKRSPTAIVEELVNGVLQPIEVGGLEGGESQRRTYALPTDRRGIVTLGPATIARSDPFGLLRRSIGHLDTEQVWVHPRRRFVRELPTGFAKDLEGQTFDTSPAGDVAFHTIRKYSPGDDIRHIHWMSTARQWNGDIMVRHYVDNRRTALTAIIDPGLAARAPELFERAVEIVASLGVSGIGRKLVPNLFIGSERVLKPDESVPTDDFLDRLSEYEASTTGQDATVTVIARALDAAPTTSVLTIISGATEASDLRVIVDQFRRRCRIVIVNVVDPAGGQSVAVPRVTVLNTVDLDSFASAWGSLG